MDRYYSVNKYLKELFEEKVYKIALSASHTCPNRDGKIGHKGCIFCSVSGSGEFAAKQKSVKEQIDSAISFIEKKAKNCKYIAYFQSFTNTYGDINYLEKCFFDAINDDRVVILSIATRPDCLQDDILCLLKRLAKIKPLWVELGLQTVHEKSARYIRRGYELEIYENAVQKLREIGAKIITHQIIGLPGETAEMIEQTARYIGRFSDGIKLQLLHVLKDSDLYYEYMEGKVKELSLEEYTSLLARCIRVLPKSVVVHRITGDGDKKTLVAPLWSGDKKRVLNYINSYFDKENVIQGIDT